jgi:hypothetical protein
LFQNDRYITQGIDAEIPLEVQAAMWVAIDLMPDPKDYLQVFDLEPLGEFVQKMIHHQEQPEYSTDVYVPLPHDTEAVTATIFVIDDGDHSTMLFPDER